MNRLLVGLAFVWAAGCGEVVIEPLVPTQAPAVSFANVVAPSFVSLGCALGGCHDLPTAANNDVGFEGLCADVFSAASPYTNPNDAANSDLIIIATQGTFGAAAHTGGAPLMTSAPEYQQWIDWIAGGAVNDCP